MKIRAIVTATGGITGRPRYEGESVEEYVARMLKNKSAIKGANPEIYTDKNEGVRPEHNIRTDRFDLALKYSDKAHQNDLLKRSNNWKEKEEPQQTPEGATEQQK